MPQDHAHVTRALDSLARGLAPFVEREMEAVYKNRWQSIVQDSFRGGRGQPNPADDQEPNWDAHSLLTVMWDQWNSVFRSTLGHAERSLVAELRAFRNQWAHQGAFQFDDTYRVYDSAERLLAAIDSPEAQWLARGKRELLKAEFDRELRAAYRRSKARRQTWQDVFIYLACCVAIVFAILQHLGTNAWLMVVSVIFTFVFLVWQRVSEPPTAQFGAHECGGCGKIIYSDVCPYCEPAYFLPAKTSRPKPPVISDQDAEPPPARVPEKPKAKGATESTEFTEKSKKG
jgi:hypothetical protein